MQRLLYILFQLDEARRYIEDGRLEQLRLALLILDNAAELQMDRGIRDDIEGEEIQERLRIEVLKIPQRERPLILQELAEWEPLTTPQKKSIDRVFDEKVKFLTERTSHLESRLAPSLKYLHRYRNEAYHRGRVRHETIRTAALMLLEINCQMLLSGPHSGKSYDPREDYTWILERFGKKPIDIFTNPGTLEIVLDQIRAGILPTDEFLITTLTEHLKNRFADLHSKLDFIAESLSLSNKEVALKTSQYRTDIKCGAVNKSKCSIDDYQARYQMESVHRLQNSVAGIKGATDRVDAFHKFSELEKEFEPAELCVNQLAEDIESSIEFQLDLQRGK